jgi:hypothetical protein
MQHQIGTTDSSTLPIHPTTGLRALAIGRRGPVWPVLGGSGEGDGNTGDVDVDDTDDGADTTGDQGTGGTDSGQDKGTQKDADTAKAEAKEVKDLPGWAQKIVRDARKEAADTRGKATAAETKLQKQLDGIAVALGLKAGEEIDPAKVQEQLTGERDTAIGERDDARRELAIFKAADKNEADPGALLDSREFLKDVGELDATDKDYGKNLVALIKQRVKDNPARYGREAPKTKRSGSADDMNGGKGKGPRTTSLHAALAARQQT